MNKSPNDPHATFAPGDDGVYPGHGVGRVTHVESQAISDQTVTVLVINFAHDGMTLRVPLHKVKACGLRGISTPQLMDAALATLKEPAERMRGVWTRQAADFAAKIKSCDPRSLAEVVRDLHPGTEGADLSHSKREVYERALSRLVHEVAAIDRTPIEHAAEKLAQFLKAA